MSTNLTLAGVVVAVAIKGRPLSLQLLWRSLCLSKSRRIVNAAKRVLKFSEGIDKSNLATNEEKIKKV